MQREIGLEVIPNVDLKYINNYTVSTTALNQLQTVLQILRVPAGARTKTFRLQTQPRSSTHPYPFVILLALRHNSTSLNNALLAVTVGGEIIHPSQ
jgi:hypothetical protein